MQKETDGREQAVEFGSRVRLSREALSKKIGKKVSQEGLADRCGLHRTYIGHVERGEVNVALLNILRIADTLEVDPGELLRGMRF